MFDLDLTSALIGAAVSAGACLAILQPWSRDRDESPQDGDPVDPWQMQSELMRISGQRQPASPELNKPTLMYAGLILEEGSETVMALVEAMRWGTATSAVPQLIDARYALEEAGKAMFRGRQRLRNLLMDCPDFAQHLDRRHAKPILDGTTDIAVVNSGFALAAGLPGSQAYAAVGTSNLSKRNPDTGLIDKEPDGKWIKGADYREPDLDAVLDPRYFGSHAADASPTTAA